jgi:hypothetical protein
VLYADTHRRDSVIKQSCVKERIAINIYLFITWSQSTPWVDTRFVIYSATFACSTPIITLPFFQRLTKETRLSTEAYHVRTEKWKINTKHEAIVYPFSHSVSCQFSIVESVCSRATFWKRYHFRTQEGNQRPTHQTKIFDNMFTGENSAFYLVILGFSLCLILSFYSYTLQEKMEKKRLSGN